MKILVTGGLGFIGSNFIRYVLSKHPNKEIVNIDKIGIGANLENLKDLKTSDTSTTTIKPQTSKIKDLVKANKLIISPESSSN